MGVAIEESIPADALCSHVTVAEFAPRFPEMTTPIRSVADQPDCSER